MSTLCTLCLPHSQVRALSPTRDYTKVFVDLSGKVGTAAGRLARSAENRQGALAGRRAGGRAGRRVGGSVRLCGTLPAVWRALHPAFKP